jgi:hypothetical protein
MIGETNIHTYIHIYIYIFLSDDLSGPSIKLLQRITACICVILQIKHDFSADCTIESWRASERCVSSEVP